MVHSRPMGSERPLTTDAEAKRKAAGCAGCFLGTFGTLGLFAFVALFAMPIIRVVRAATWDETPCRIMSSGVSQHSTGKDATYSVDITFEYEAGGRRHTSNRYSFLEGMSSSGSAGKWEIVNRHMPGTRTVCYVDPADPTYAVLRRGFSTDFLVALVPLVFAVVGFGFLIAFRRQVSRPKVEVEPVPAGPARLKASGGWLTVIILGIVTLIWNVASWWGLMAQWTVPKGDFGDWFFGLLPLLFPAIGLFLAGMVIHAALARFNPHTTIDVTRNGASVGETFGVEWVTEGRLDQVTEFRILLEGTEVAVEPKKRGRTLTETFASIPIAGSETGQDYRSGRGTARIPSGTMHSFKAGQNEIRWNVRVLAKLRLRPDVDETFPIEVRP